MPMIEETKVSTDILEKLLSRTSIEIRQTNNWGLEYLSAMKFGSSFKENIDDTTIINGWTFSNLLRYDDKTFSLMYKVPITDDIELEDGFSNLFMYQSEFSNTKKWRLPYVYEPDINRVWFMNLPLLSDMQVYRDDIELAYNKFNEINEESWVNKVLSACKENDSNYLDSMRKWYPVALLSDLFILELEETGINTNATITFSDFFYNVNFSDIFNNSVVLVGPYQLNVQNPITETLKFIFNDGYDKLPLWAVRLYSASNQSNEIPSKTKTYSIKFGNTNLFIPSKNMLLLEDNQKNLSQVSKTAVKLSSTFIENIKDIYNKAFLEEKNLNEKFKNANSIISLIYLFSVAVIPRILFVSLFLFQILSLIVNIKFIRLFCERVFDFYKFLTFGRISYNQVNPVKVWLTGTLGLIIIILLSRDYGSYIMTKLISLILNILEN